MSLNLSGKRSSSVSPLNSEPKGKDSMISFVATMVREIAEEVEEVVEFEDYEQFTKKFENASLLEIMDKALEKYGNDIAIAFSVWQQFLRLHTINTCDLEHLLILNLSRNYLNGPLPAEFGTSKAFRSSMYPSIYLPMIFQLNLTNCIT